jgi:serine/threonine protein kinase
MSEGCKNTALVDFQPLDKIGEGSFSWVYKVRRIADDKIYALKKVYSPQHRSSCPIWPPRTSATPLMRHESLPP